MRYLGLLMLMLGTANVSANDFPTQARVEFVLECMQDNGGQSYNTLYPCICMVDHIAEKMTFADYTAAQTLSFLYATPGERGGVFRDAATDARGQISALGAAKADARRACFVK